jgi:hypothetical protein
MPRCTLLLGLPLLLLACDRAPVAPDTQDAAGAMVTNRAVVAASHAGGWALAFDGIDDYVEVPDAPSVDMTDGFTIAAWIYLEEYTEWASIVTKGTYVEPLHHPNNYTIHQSGPTGGSVEGHLRFSDDRADQTIPLPESNTQIPLHEWHYVAVSYDGATLRFYYDGQPDGSSPEPGPLLANDTPLYVGVDFPGHAEYWHGRIDELRIWNQALDPELIRAAMHGHASPMASALVGYWSFNEGSGDIAHDQSVYGNDGQLIGGATWVRPGAPLGPAGM